MRNISRIFSRVASLVKFTPTGTISSSNVQDAIAEVATDAAATYIPLSYLDADGTLLANSDSKIATQKATKTYADSKIAGLLNYRGAYDASVNLYPSSGGSGAAGAVMKGDMWVISVAGTMGGVDIQIGDSLIANVDTPGQASSKWNTLNTNISYVPEDNANKVISISGSSTDTQYPSAKLLYDQLVLKVNTSVTVNGHALSSNVTVSKSDVGLGSVENTALSTWAGTSNIVTVGTITTGTWHGSVLDSTYGGTGINNAGRTLTLNTNSGSITFTNPSTTLTVSNTGSISGSNSGDVALATNSGLSISGQTLNMGTPSSVGGTSTNSVTTNTHTHAFSYKSSDGTSGVSGSFTYVKSWDQTGTITIKDGLVTSIT